MMMAARAHDCLVCATTTALARTITCYDVVIQCIKGVMGLQKCGELEIARGWGYWKLRRMSGRRG